MARSRSPTPALVVHTADCLNTWEMWRAWDVCVVWKGEGGGKWMCVWEGGRVYVGKGG